MLSRDQLSYNYMNNELIGTFNNLYLFRIIAVVMIIVAVFVFIMLIWNKRDLSRGKGINSVINNAHLNRRRDQRIIRLNKMLKIATAIVNLTPFRVSPEKKDYLDYNLKRANRKIPGDMRYMLAEEWTAMNVGITVILLIMEIGIAFISLPIAIMAIGITIIGGSFIPQANLRGIVEQRDKLFKSEFPDFYLMIHYVLAEKGNVPIERVMKSFALTSDKEEINRFIDISIGHIETYGEFPAMDHIIKDYKEVGYACRFARLVKQMLNGGDISTELKGFREEILNARKHEIIEKTDKLIAKASRYVMLIYVILFQAVVSAMVIYVPDITSGLNIFRFN